MFLSRNILRAYAQSVQCTSKGFHLHAVNATLCDTSGEASVLRENTTKEGRIKCTLLPGDGVGPELFRCVQDIFNAACVPVEFECFNLSEINIKDSPPLEKVIESIKTNGICLKGILDCPLIATSDDPVPLVTRLRKALDLFANVVHIKSLPNVKTRHGDLDLIIVREQTEGEYSALEHESIPGITECLKIVTRKKSERIAKFAFDYAVRMKRKKVTSVHKANIMKLADGLFMHSCEKMSKLYPRIEYESMIVDNTTMQMVSKPSQFDVLVTSCLYGDILDNLATGLVGGAGIVASVSYSSRYAIFELGTQHPYYRAVGKDIANPTAVVRAAAYLLNHINLNMYTDLIKYAFGRVLTEGKVRTKDLGGTASTSEFIKAVIAEIKTCE